MRTSGMAAVALAAAALVLMAGGCGQAPAANSGSNSAGCGGSRHSVEVVVGLNGGRSVSRCVGFSAKTINAETALRRSGIEFSSEHFSFGDEVCQLDHEPRAYTSCTGTDYWALFVWRDGHWRSASVGISDLSLSPGEALGWRYDPTKGLDPGPTQTPPR